MGDYKKPPLGLRPQKYYKLQTIHERQIEICNAILRYEKEGMKIPEEWLSEYKELDAEFDYWYRVN